MRQSILRYFNLKALDTDKAQIAFIEPNGVILWFNLAWKDFALRNGGEDILTRFGVGASYYAGISGELRGAFQDQLTHCLNVGEPFCLEYECSSTTRYKLYRLRALPIEQEALLLEHSELVSYAREVTAEAEPFEPNFIHPTRLIYQCSNCRRTKTLDGAWVWVPKWVNASPSCTSHGICKVCAGFYWGQKLKIPLPL
jgi:hypothetical protein